jgi:hypothetical protein
LLAFIHDCSDSPHKPERGGQNGITALVQVDVSAESLALCMAKGLHTELARCELDTEPLPFADDSFGAVTCVGVLSYVRNYEHVRRRLLGRRPSSDELMRSSSGQFSFFQRVLVERS